MAQCFVAKIAEDRGLGLTVESAGTLPGDRPMSPNALEVIGVRGVDMTGHRSRLVDTEMTGRSDLVLGMEREHVREVVLLDPSAWPRTFSLKEVVRRGERQGSRPQDLALRDWAERVGRGRRREELLGYSPEDDVEDPMGGTMKDFEATGAEILDLVRQLVALIEPDN